MSALGQKRLQLTSALRHSEHLASTSRSHIPPIAALVLGLGGVLGDILAFPYKGAPP